MKRTESKNPQGDCCFEWGMRHSIKVEVSQLESDEVTKDLDEAADMIWVFKK